MPKLLLATLVLLISSPVVATIWPIPSTANLTRSGGDNIPISNAQPSAKQALASGNWVMQVAMFSDAATTSRDPTEYAGRRPYVDVTAYGA